METTSTLHSKASFYKGMMLLFFCGLLLTQTASAHSIEYYSTSGCLIGSTVKVDGVVVNAPGNTQYHWQYRTSNTGSWTCFNEGNNTINGHVFSVSGTRWLAPDVDRTNDAPQLNILNATAELENVQVRCLMSENADPCNPGGNAVYGGDGNIETKMYRIHIWTGGDCGGTTPGCLGNLLTNADGYYGGFEAVTYDATNRTFTYKNFGGTAASTAFTWGTTTSTYQTLNNPYAVKTSYGQFAPHSGNYQMIVNGNSTASAKVWYETVSVTAGSTYAFAVWAAKVDASNATLSLKVNGTEVTSRAFTSSDAVGAWVQLCGLYTVPNGVTSLEIAIYDKSGSAHNYTIDDICFRKLSNPTIGDFVWNDVNKNGKQDAGEPGVGNIVVTLYDNTTNLAIQSTVTGGKGEYLFSNVPAAAGGTSYYILFSSLPPNTQWATRAAAGTNSTNDSDPQANGKTLPFVVMPGVSRSDIDAGIATIGGPLPIGTSPLQVLYTKGISQLNWNTSTEVNGSRFEVEHSTNGVSFDPIGIVNAVGNSSAKVNYKYDDKQVSPGLNYYRLRIYDRDGQYTYSNIVTVNAVIKGVNITGIYPNPFMDKVLMTISTENNQQVNIRLFDNAGRLIKTQTEQVDKGLTNLTLNNLGILHSGFYMMEVNVDNQRHVYKLAK